MGPIRVSANGRSFVDQDGKPFFWLGDTQWELFRHYTPDEARTILETRKGQGFTVFQIMMTGVGDGTPENLEGHVPWMGNNPAAPNENYFQPADTIVELARQVGMVLVIGVYHQLQRDRITPANARAYARWLAGRYRNTPHIVWSMYPQAKPEYVPVLRELAAGLREADDGTHLITVHPDPSPTSSSFIHEEPWLDFNSIQTCVEYERIGTMVAEDCRRIPTKPVVMAEGGYEGLQFGKLQTPLQIRRQAFWSHLAGGHHTYGHNDCWANPGAWRQWIQAPGGLQMGVYRNIIQSCHGWWNGIPEQSLFAANSDNLNLHTGMRSAQGDWTLVYLSENRPVSIHMNKVAAAPTVEAAWIAPTTGEVTALGRLPASGTRDFIPPAGWEDAILRITAC